MNLFRVAPFDQNLSICGRDLLDNEATLESLRVYPHSVILLKVSHFITFDYSEPSFNLYNEGGDNESEKPVSRLLGIRLLSCSYGCEVRKPRNHTEPIFLHKKAVYRNYIC